MGGADRFLGHVEVRVGVEEHPDVNNRGKIFETELCWSETAGEREKKWMTSSGGG